MSYLSGIVGCVFVLIMLLHVPHPMPFAWMPYGFAGALALIALKREIGDAVVRALAIATTLTMFFFFAGFFLIVPKLAADWYQHQEGWSAVCRILSAFAMIPVLSDYSCRLKADCRHLAGRTRLAFFSVPGHIPPSR